jgi:hypothetical protein
MSSLYALVREGALVKESESGVLLVFADKEEAEQCALSRDPEMELVEIKPLERAGA